MPTHGVPTLVEAASVDEFRASPVGRYLVGEHFVVWCPTPTLCGTSFWGRPGEADLRALVRLFDLAKCPGMRAPIDGVMDGRWSAGVDPLAYDLLFRTVRQRWREVPGLLRRQAVLLPTGWLGATMAGFYALLPLRLEYRMFGSLAGVFDWLAVSGAADTARTIERLVDDVRGTPPLVLAVRASIGRNLRRATLASTATDLGVSARTLQRRLESGDTSFRAELVAARVRAATELVANSDQKIETVARMLGVGSSSNLARLVRRITGRLPREHRAGEQT